ncbi:MAG: YigZ family protein, partial [candidate division Zixibacteria bacterium]|nr:YigZ family protein [candidate division Zixibacteria bacterium]
MDDLFYTIENTAKVEIKRKGSRFIAETVIVHSIESANEELAAIRKREHAATHHCYAYRVGMPDNINFKYSDDGEPSGTAGRPIYDVVCGREVTNILLVVTRYYGGTKLGTGGLARAYGDAARSAMEKSGRCKNYLSERFNVEIEFNLYDKLVRILHRLQVGQNQTDFSDHVTLELEVRRTMIEQTISEIVQLS